MDKVKDFFGNIVDKAEDMKETIFHGNIQESIFGDVFSKSEDAKAKKKLEQAEANKRCYDEYKEYTRKNLEKYDKEKLESIASSGKTRVFLQHASYDSYPGREYGSYAKQGDIDARCAALRDVSREWNQHGDLPVRMRYQEKKTPFPLSGRCYQCELYLDWTREQLMIIKAERVIGQFTE